MPLHFETAVVPAQAAPQRMDIACFIGYVARRRTPLPASVRDELRAAGWIDGPWGLSEPAIQSLFNLPVTVSSWEAFDRLFAWRARPIASGGTATCATYLGSAVRRFFSQGGQRAVIVRSGDPWPYLQPPGDRGRSRAERIRGLVPAFTSPAGASVPFDSTHPRTWRGIQHLYGLAPASMVCLPDLADACATDPPPPDDVLPLTPSSEGFVECSETLDIPQPDTVLRRLRAPRCNAEGLTAWALALALTREFIAVHRRDVVVVNALVLIEGAAAQRDPRDFFEQANILRAAGDDPSGAASAFVQLAYPWVATRFSGDLPEHLEPADGMLAGVIAAGALARGTFRSVAGTRLSAVLGTEPIAGWSAEPSNPWSRLAQNICLIARDHGGFALQSDVTTSPNAAWRAGSVTRMMASVLRAARATGESELFEANGPLLWSRVRLHLETLLTSYWREGGLGGASPAEAFDVRCDRSTMTQNDLDNGRLIAKITVLPVAAIERITVVLALSATGQAATEVREVA